MSRKNKKAKKGSGVTSVGCDFPQVSTAQPPMPNPYMGQIPPAYSNAFVYEPVPIKKRHREIIPVLMVIVLLLSIAAGVLAYLFNNMDAVKQIKDESVRAAWEESVEKLGNESLQKMTEEDVETVEFILDVIVSVLAASAVACVLGLILSIWAFIAMCHISQEINTIAFDYDRKTTPFYCLAFFLSLLTLGIYDVIYMNNLCARIGGELRRRSNKYKFDEGTFWGWCVIGSIILIGPIVFYFKLFKAMRKLIDDYNIYG